MLQRLKNILKGEKNTFKELCTTNNLGLDYEENKSEIGILIDVFQNREYSDCFPFYKDAVIVDIGAHYGYFSLFANKNLGAGSVVYAIEPNSNNFGQLKKNVLQEKAGNIKPFQLAIGRENGTARLYRGRNPNHSIVELNPLNHSNSSFEEVKANTLEQFFSNQRIERADFVKMDCEGAEYAIFASTPKHVFDKITTISIEFHDLKDTKTSAMDIIKVLICNGFEVVKHCYERTNMNLNYGKIIGTKAYRQLAEGKH